METIEEDQSGILEVIEAEKEELEIDLEELRKKSEPEKALENLDFDFFTLLEDKGVLITGVALAEGIWKNVVYSAEEIKKAVSQLIGKPIKVEHGNDKEFGDNKVGEVVESKWDEDLKACKFKAKVTEPKAIDYVKAGRFKAVSMSTWMDKIPIGQEGVKMGLDFKFAELSLVENPACDRCFIFHCEQLSKQMKKDLKGEEKDTKVVGELKMEEEKNSAANLEISEEELSEENPIILAWVEDNEELELLELSSEEELEELRKKRKIYGYYYGYPKLYGYEYPYYGYGTHPYYGYGYYPGYYPSKYRKYKGPEHKSEDLPFVIALVEENDSLEEIPLKSETELDELRKQKGKGVKGYKYAYSPYGYYPYKYKKYKYPKVEKKSVDEDLEELPFEEMEDTIVCKACGEKFSNFKDFITHWAKAHMDKYGKYKPAEKDAGKYYPKYYGYGYYYPYYPKYKYPEMKSDEDLKKGQLKIVFNKNTKKYTVFEVPEEGLWKIVKVFDTKDEAQKFITGGGKEEQAKVSPTPITCPVCGLKFENEVDFNKHWTEAHEGKYGVYKPQDGEYPPLPEQKSELKEEINLKEGKENMTEEKKEEPKAEVKEVPKVEPPKTEAPKVEVPKEVPKEEPKVEVPKVEVPKEEPKVEVPKTEPKVEQKPIEIPIVLVPTIREVPKEEPKVEVPKVEAPKEEAPKVEPPKPKMTEEDILKIVKESPEAQRLIFEKWVASKRSKN